MDPAPDVLEVRGVAGWPSHRDERMVLDGTFLKNGRVLESPRFGGQLPIRVRTE